jgi:cbb3-type cytochrome oxidase maturation protein
MESLYLLIPLGLLAVVSILALLWWSIHSGQYEDLEGPAHSILFDNDHTSHEKSNK